MIERAHQILSRFEIHAYLAADGGINLREQSGRDLDEGNAAEISRGDKTCQIADDAAAERGDEGFPFQTVRGQLIAAGVNGFEVFGRFSRRHHNRNRFKSTGAQTFFNGLGVKLRDVCVRNNCASMTQFHPRAMRSELLEQSRSDQNGITPRAQWHGDITHERENRRTTCAVKDALPKNSLLLG